MKVISIPKTVEEIISALHQAGEEAYPVGGCVRDSLMGKKPKDWDITTSALPEKIKRIFPKTVDTGIRHGTVTVLHKGEAIEVTTFRIDGIYEDHRHPKEVSFTSSLQEDLARRDFTVNAMAYSLESGVLDYFGGREDFKNKMIRCVGRAEDRFEEDALRMMRAIRFAAALGFTLETETEAAIRKKKDLLRAVSQERIRIEFQKTLQSNHPEYLAYFAEFGLLPYFLPELHLPSKREDAFYFALKQLPAEGYSRAGYIFRQFGAGESSEKQVGSILRRMTFDNHTMKTVAKIASNPQIHFSTEPVCYRKIISQFGAEIARECLRLDLLQDNSAPERAWKLFADALSCPLTIADLAVNGDDVLALGYAKGKEVGEMLQALLQWVLEEPARNSKSTLIQYLKNEKVRKETAR